MTDPRVARTKDHVLAVAGDLLADEGRQGFSIDAVARRSGVARTTIYRHWPELGDLLFDTFRAMAHVVPIVETGSVRDDLVAIYGALASGFGNSCLGRCMPVLLDMTRRDPALATLHKAFIAERRAPSRAAIEAGVERGELPGDLDVDGLIDRIAGPVFYRHLVVQDPMTVAEVERLVDDVLNRRLPSRPARSRPSRIRRAAS
jgi:AcrR family transcriptional regulator